MKSSLRLMTAKAISILTLFFLLASCSASSVGKSWVAVGVRGINYTNETFSYIVKDPANPSNSSGGELINSYSSGGLMCCYSLPRKWQPGLKVLVKSTYWMHRKVDGKLPQFKKDFVLEVPPYVDEQPGELWIIRNPDGSVNVVSSDYSPAHPKWPGLIKGWPVPSEEYKAEKRRSERENVEERLAVQKIHLRQILENPEAYAKRLWPKWQEWREADYLRFSGPGDPLLHKYLENEFKADIAAEEAKLNELIQN